MKKHYTFILLFLLAGNIFGQQKSTKVFTSLEEIKNAPKEVLIISLKKKKLKEFPKEILQCTNLKELDLTSNKLKEIPEEIRELKHLKRLTIANNYLVTLPEIIGELTELQYINLNRNDIYYLPNSFGKLTKLDTLILWSNVIRKFPESMAQINLKALDIRAISMNIKEQKAIFNLFPNARIKYDRACNCH